MKLFVCFIPFDLPRLLHIYRRLENARITLNTDDDKPNSRIAPKERGRGWCRAAAPQNQQNQNFKGRDFVDKTI